MAAALARHGEGPIALYVAADGLAAAGARARRRRPVRPERAAGAGTDVGTVPDRRGLGPGPLHYHRPMIERATDRPPGRDGSRRRAASRRCSPMRGSPSATAASPARLERFAAPGSHVIVADVEGEVLGFIAFHVVHRFEGDEPFVRIVALVVDPGVRERGVGRLLMDEAEQIGRRRGRALRRGDGRPPPRQRRGTSSSRSGTTARSRRTFGSASDGLDSEPRIRVGRAGGGVPAPAPDRPGRSAARPALGARRSPTGRRPASRSARSRWARRDTSSGSSSATAACTRSRSCRSASLAPSTRSCACSPSAACRRWSPSGSPNRRSARPACSSPSTSPTRSSTGAC